MKSKTQTQGKQVKEDGKIKKYFAQMRTTLADACKECRQFEINDRRIKYKDC